MNTAFADKYFSIEAARI